MSLTLETDYVTFCIYKKTEATPSIRGMFGFRLINGKDANEISQKEFRDFIYFEPAKHVCRDVSKLQLTDTWWFLTESTDNTSSIHNSDLINTLLLSDGISVDIELPQEYKDIDIYAHRFESEKHLSLEIPDKDYYIDYVLHDAKIEEHQLNVHYFNIEDNTGKSDLLYNEFDNLFDDVNDMTNTLKIKLDKEKFKLVDIQEFIDYYKLVKTSTNNQAFYIMNKGGLQFFETLESLKTIVIQYNVFNPTSEEKISLYDLLRHSLNVSAGLGLEIGEYSIAIDYASAVLALGITIRIDNNV